MSEKNKLDKIRDQIDKALIENGLEGTKALVFGCKVIHQD